MSAKRALLLIFLALSLSACSTAGAAPLPYVDLDQREPLPIASSTEVKPLRVAVAAIISPTGTVESYHDLAVYIGDLLGRPVELIQRRTYAEVNDLVAGNEVDLAFVCTSAYVAGHEEFGMQLLAAPQINGELVYYSELIVPSDSTTQSMADLRGKRFAFTDPMSFSGRVYPTYLVEQLDEQVEDFFGHVFFTYSHDRAVQAVADHIADGAAVDSLVLGYVLRDDPSLADRIRVIHRSPPFGIPPVVIPPGLPAYQQQRLAEILFDMDEDPAGQAILVGLGIDRFVPIDDQAYADIRRLIEETGSLP